MILVRSMSPEWLSNTWLLGERPGGCAVIVDSGGPPEPILQAVTRHGLRVTHILCTHHHHDHVAHNDLFHGRFDAPVAGGRLEADRFRRLDLLLEDGQEIASGALRIRALHIPGHTAGQMAFVAGEERVFTGDTLFRGSVGGTRAPGHTSFDDLRRSILDVLMALPPAMEVHPGHTESTTIAREWEGNPFIRAWRGLDPPGSLRCQVRGEPATLLLRAPDYDGGTKCWVRFATTAREDVVPGSWTRDEIR